MSKEPKTNKYKLIVVILTGLMFATSLAEKLILKKLESGVETHVEESVKPSGSQSDAD